MVLWRLVFLLLLAATIRVHSQFDSNGFLSIDCGLTEISSYFDNKTSLKYVSDKQFINTGVTAQILDKEGWKKEFQTLRYFPGASFLKFDTCYTIRSLTVQSKYLIRAFFVYGNYDNLNRPPIIDIYLGVSFWGTVNTSTPTYTEIIFEATADFLQVCLKYNTFVPFISSLHLRKLSNGMYDRYVSSIQSLRTVWRYNLGESSGQFVRYPDDKYDRGWESYSNAAWTNISTNATVAPNPELEDPSLVIQTAATTSTTKEPLVMNWKNYNITAKYCVFLHFAEIQDNRSTTDRREFNVFAQGSMVSNKPYVPSVLSTEFIDFNYTNAPSYNISLEATSVSTLPPLLNAIELYTILPVTATTYAPDVTAIYIIKEYYKIVKGWSGDPCIPYSWNGISCTRISNVMRITYIYLSGEELTGSVSDHFGNLTALTSLSLTRNNLSGSIPNSLSQLSNLATLSLTRNNLSGSMPNSLSQLTNLDTLDLSYNNFSGSLPDSLGQLARLVTLDLSYNHFSGSLPESLDNTALTTLDITGTSISTALPPGLQRKRQDNVLHFRYGATNPTPSPSSSTPSRKKNAIIAISVVVPLLLIAVATATASWLKRKKNSRCIASLPSDCYDPNRQFSYKDIKRITNNFDDERSIGTGGYGTVYSGLLEDGVQVAVKVRSHSSKQGIKEFSAEAKNLTRVHHKNLVSLMGYCIDKNCMAIVYEFMQEGNLQNKLKDNRSSLSWLQRLQIVYESALGLEYLHQACNPPLIHRDVKTSNILLSANLEAKVADFGLSRAFDNEASCHVLTTVVGTIGYLDPEYYTTNQLSAKSDVFSFGIVLLEVITGRAPIVPGEGPNLHEWVHQKLSEGDIQSIVDPKMEGKYDINSVWKVTNLACKCTENACSNRPTMTEVVAELKESLNLEITAAGLHTGGTDKFVTDVSHDSVEIAFMGATSVSGPLVR